MSDGLHNGNPVWYSDKNKASRIAYFKRVVERGKKFGLYELVTSEGRTVYAVPDSIRPVKKEVSRG